MEKVGITGTRNGMNIIQKTLFIKLINDLKIIKFSHGDCEGVDEETHYIIIDINPILVIGIHPPKDTKYRAYCKGKNIIIYKSKPYLDRNKDIVNNSSLMVAIPETNYEINRSGTWATIRYAKKVNKPLIIIFPNGQIQKYNENIGVEKWIKNK